VAGSAPTPVLFPEDDENAAIFPIILNFPASVRSNVSLHAAGFIINLDEAVLLESDVAATIFRTSRVLDVVIRIRLPETECEMSGGPGRAERGVRVPRVNHS
jgi:hypothetical protein